MGGGLDATLLKCTIKLPHRSLCQMILVAIRPWGGPGPNGPLDPPMVCQEEQLTFETMGMFLCFTSLTRLFQPFCANQAIACSCATGRFLV